MQLVVRVGKRGIEGIKRDYSMTDADISRLNTVNLHDIHEGTPIIVEILDDIEYHVRPFDTIESIANNYHVTPQYIREYNNIDSIFLGDIIYIERTE